MTDLLDERLASVAERWQSEQPAPPLVPLDRLDEQLPRRADWRAVLAVAAAVVLVGGGAVAVAKSAGGDQVTPSTTTGTSGSATPQVHRVSSIVPWRDLAPTHPTIGHRSHGRVVTPFDNISATGRIHGHLSPGDTLRFVVTLESYTDVPLDPCPDYSITFGSGFHRSWQLNCRQVPYRQSKKLTPATAPTHGVTRLHAGSWHPVLPAGTRVRFEMTMTVPDDPGRQKVLWNLVGPTAMPGFYGIVHVS
jgi:hypothetical protein